ncbi:uncharacterized protein LOC109711144 isoform X2 [Ananas comosus]|uniref:Uncharacterized protein LOC109711144 isoform X2 n=1 Tax=Ananas comosus TaxID=4615 RepID=A0A6P5F8N4_ANACO|nr:uncharacterized protein LOC109711144 isoform X2 [Ananas comosus]
MLSLGKWQYTNIVCRIRHSISFVAALQLLSCIQYHQGCMLEVDYFSVHPNNGSTSFVGKVAEWNSLEYLNRLSQQVESTVMEKCFRSITDPRSGINLIHNVVYKSKIYYSGLMATGQGRIHSMYLFDL